MYSAGLACLPNAMENLLLCNTLLAAIAFLLECWPAEAGVNKFSSHYAEGVTLWQALVAPLALDQGKHS